nr:triose-phosphate isomerase family protein [Spelaeicoccus albus]
MYFGYRQTLDWVRSVAEIARESPAVQAGGVELAVLPGFPALEGAASALRGTPVTYGAQNLAFADSGAFTGEVSGRMLAELGCTYVEIGHAERRSLFGETLDVVRAKTATAYRAGLTPILCVGETEKGDPGKAADICKGQIADALGDQDRTSGDKRLVVAYEPVWAIGAPAPAGADHIRAVCSGLKAFIAELTGIRGTIIYGGSARVGLLSQLAGEADGLFLGRFAHDPGAVRRIVDEAGDGHGQ